MRLKNCLTLVFLFLFSAGLSAEPQLSVRLDRSALYEGEAFHYQLTLSDENPIAENITPDTSAWTDFDSTLLGRQTERSISSIFSETTSTFTTHFIYSLVPKRAGSLKIPLPQVIVQGTPLVPQSFSVQEGEEKISSDYSVAVQVSGPEKQDFVLMSLETNRRQLYPHQPLEVSLTILVKGLPDRYAEIDPLSLPRQRWEQPQLQIPWAEEFPKGFRAEQDLNGWLGDYLLQSSRGGFSINGYSDRDILSFSTVLFHFSPAPRQIKRPDSQGNETLYWEYRFTRKFLPTEIGTGMFAPVILRGMFSVAEESAPDRIVWQRIYAIAPSVSVDVVDVPQAQRPQNYIGAFGTFTFDVHLSPQQARQGDPMTLTLHLTGEGSTANVRPVDLSTHPDIAPHFRVHMPPTEEIEGDPNATHSCVFTYTIRPLHSGKFEFPPVAVSVFDVETEEFVTLQSLPIPLEVAETETINSAMSFAHDSHGTDGALLAEEGLFANKTALGNTLFGLPMKFFSFANWIITVAVLVVSYGLIVLAVLVFRYQRRSPKRLRREAFSRAAGRLEEILTALRKEDSSPHAVSNSIERSVALRGVLLGYIADKTGGTEQGMTTSDAYQKLRENRVSETLAEEIRTTLESLDAVKYGGKDIPLWNTLTETVTLLLKRLDAVQ